jgi:hypothetical protein
MAAGLMLVFVIVQMMFGLLFLIWLWILRVRSLKATPADKREGLLRAAVICFTLGVAVFFYFLLAPGTSGPHSKAPALATFFLGCAGFVLALMGKGKGRIVTAIACCGLAISWLPFILP